LELWQAAALGGIGVAAGWLNVMAGGGSMLTVPAMLLFGVPGPVANGTNRIAILAQNIVATLTFRKRGYAQPWLGLTLGLAALPGALVGAFTGASLQGEAFDTVLAAVMVVSLLLMWHQGQSTTAGDHSPSVDVDTQTGHGRFLAGHLCMVGVGFWGGLIQIGVGFVLMPVLHRVMHFDLVRVNQYKVLIVLIYTLPALVVFATTSEVLWLPGLALALGNSIGGWLGAHSTMKQGSALVRVVFNLALIAFIVKLVFF
jgi:uncharacterized membrane protein YfcA